MNKELLLKNLRNIPDFPIPGIQFKDVTSLFKNPECMQELDNSLYELYKDKGITKIVGIESRGFVMASALAIKLNPGFVPIRKPGKLPADAIDKNDVVLIHDDLLATGGTMLAAYHLVKKLNPKKVMINYIIELEGLKGREIFPADAEIDCLLTLEGK